MTVREIAKIAGVSPATISLVLNNKPGVSNIKRKQIQDIINRLDYKVKTKSENSKNKNLLFLKLVKAGFLVEQNAGFISKIMDSIQNESNKLGYSLQVKLISDNYKEEIKKLDFESFDGIFVVGTELVKEDYCALDFIKKPFIVIDNSMPFYNCNSITMSNIEMVFEAIKQLSSSGEKDFGYFRSSFDSQNFLERKKGVDQATKYYGLSFSKEKEFRLEATLKGSYEGMSNYLNEGRKVPRIVFADNDIIAIGAINALISKGYRIPEDISIIGFDDIFLAETSIPPLSTIHVQRTMIGKMATVTLINEIKSKSPTYYKTAVGGQLIIRKSSL